MPKLANADMNEDAPHAANAGRWLRLFAPLAIGVLLLAAWEAVVRLNNIPPYLLASPSVIAKTIVAE